MRFLKFENGYSFGTDIPEIFYSSKNNKPIECCALCGQLLSAINEPYMIEKAFEKKTKNNAFEVIFEYALCLTCQGNTTSELSKESVANIRMYFDLYVDVDKRQKELSNPENFKLSNCINNCIITDKPVAQYNEYQIGGYFYQNHMLIISPPFAIGEKAMEELQEVISKKTRDFLDGFKDKILPVDMRDKVPEDFLILI